jgi:hypothetical protein
LKKKKKKKKGTTKKETRKTSKKNIKDVDNDKQKRYDNKAARVKTEIREAPDSPAQGGCPKEDVPQNLENFIVQKFSQKDYVQNDHENDLVRNV